VERWVGDVQPTFDAAEAPDDRTALLAVVKDLASRGASSFAVGERKQPDGRVTTMVVDFGIKRLDHLLMDTHVEVKISYPAEPNGLFAKAVGEEVDALEKELLDALGKDAVFVGHETGRGQRGIHLHVAPTGPALARITEWERAHPSWTIETVAMADPQ